MGSALKTVWLRFLRLLGMWVLLAIPAYAQYGGWKHDRVGRICSSSSCTMCQALHAKRAHGIDYRWYSDALAPHYAAHHPKAVKPKKLAVKRLPFEPTPNAQVLNLVGIVRPRSSDVIYDPGCGDGRLLIQLCKDSGATGIGYEINPDIAKLARTRVAKAGLSERITIWNIDSTLVSMTGASVVVCYLFPGVLKKLNFSNARIAASYQHEIPGATKVGDWYVTRKKTL